MRSVVAELSGSRDVRCVVETWLPGNYRAGPRTSVGSGWDAQRGRVGQLEEARNGTEVIEQKQH